ncbi:unnamed protein product, partial [Laminaria digitata]
MSAPLSPHESLGHRGSRHQRDRRQGPPHRPSYHSTPTVRGGLVPGGGKHGHGHPHPPHEHGHRHEHEHGRGHHGGDLLGESEREEGKRLRGEAHGPGQHVPRRRYGGGTGSRSHDPPHGSPLGPPHGPFHGPFREEGTSGSPHGLMSHAYHGSPSRG